MKLEVISRLPKTKSAKSPILFVHGAFAGAWCWDEYFLPYFAKQGYPAYALSLRGHGHSEGADSLHSASLKDYVMDVVHVVKQLPSPPILVGHSMGGMIVQKYLERNIPTAAILMNSVPPVGLYASSIYMAFSDPLLLQQIGMIQQMGPQVASLNTMKKALFSDSIPSTALKKYFRHMQGESHRVVFDMLGLNLPCPLLKRPKVPMLVLGAEKDAFLPSYVVAWTAGVYGAQSYIFPNTAHAMMLEENWQQVADYIISWLNKRVHARKEAELAV